MAKDWFSVPAGQQQQFHFGFGQRAFLGSYTGALDHLNRSADFAMTLSRMPNCQSKAILLFHTAWNIYFLIKMSNYLTTVELFDSEIRSHCYCRVGRISLALNLYILSKSQSFVFVPCEFGEV